MGVVVPFEEARDPAESLQPLLDIVAEDMQAVNRIILDKAVSDVELIPKLAHHLIELGGKRLRPMLTIAAAKLCGYQRDGHIRLAAAVEFMHTATLLHDDVVDESDYRRGKASARRVWGNQASVLVGDFLLGQAFRMMVEVGSLPRAQDPVRCRRRHRRRRGDAARRRQEYGHDRGRLPRHHRRQDGRPVLGRRRGGRRHRQPPGRGAGGAAGPTAATSASPSSWSTMRSTIRATATRLGKSVGDDFREGKITLPVILCFRRGGDARARLLEAHAERRQDRGRRLRARHRADEEAQRHRGDAGARRPLRRHRPRRARHLPGRRHTPAP